MDVRNMYHIILEIVGPREQWPVDVLRYLWRQTPRGQDFLKYQERFRLAVFLYVNDVPFELFRRWCLQLNLLRDQSAMHHIYSLYQTFNREYCTKINRYSAYNVRLGYDIYCSGNIHYYHRN